MLALCSRLNCDAKADNRCVCVECRVRAWSVECVLQLLGRLEGFCNGLGIQLGSSFGVLLWQLVKVIDPPTPNVGAAARTFGDH